MNFAPPLQEIRFALGEIADVDVPSVALVLEQAARFASEVYAPLYAIGDKQGSRLEQGRVVLPDGFAEAYRAYCAAGWPTLQHPVEIGGQGLGASVSVAVAEMFCAANMALCLSMMPAGGAAALIERFGTDDQKRRFLPPLVSGKWTVTMTMTEPQAGSDLGAIRTKAVLDTQGSYRIFGEKVMISFGEHEMTENILHLVLARSPDGPEGVKGLSLYLVMRNLVGDDGSSAGRNDVVCIGLEHKMGVRGSPTATLVFGEREGAHAELLGKENAGIEQLFVLLNRARLNVGVFGLGSCERARQAALAYAKERMQGRDRQGRRVPIIHHQDVRRMLMHMSATTEAARAIAYYTASLMDKSEAADEATAADLRARLELVTPITKAWCTEMGFASTSLGVQVFGGLGYMEECEASQCFRDARVHMIYEGTTAIHSNDLIFRKVARDQGAAAAGLSHEISADIDLAIQRGGRVGKAAEILGGGLQALRRATQHALKNSGVNAAVVQRSAVHYLMLFGAVLGGWLLMRSALLAEKNMTQWGARFSDRKAGTALFYMEHLLRPAAALETTFVSGEAEFDLDA